MHVNDQTDVPRPQSDQPIPRHAEKVFSGVIFNVYQWQQELFDGSTTTFEKIKRIDTVNVLPVLYNGKILLTRQSQPGGEPFIGALGGRIDPDESPLQAAQRELSEEAGYTAEHWHLWDSVQPFSKIDWAVYTFVAKQCERVGEARPDAGEKIELIEVDFDDYLELVLRTAYRDHEILLKLCRLRNQPGELRKVRELFRASRVRC